MRKTIKKHKYKIAIVAIPIVLVITFSLGLEDRTSLKAVPQQSTQISPGDQFSLDIVVDAKQPINVLGSLVTFPRNLVEVSEISTEDSLINLWVNEPSFENNLGILMFAGGTTQAGGWLGEGNVITVTFTALETGEAKIDFHGSIILSHDGLGTSVRHRTQKVEYEITNSE